jgi:hypothetical protein
MTNIKLQITNYCKTWWMIIMQPILFYTKLKVEDWKEGALTFLLITSWLLGLAATVVIFVIHYIYIGGTLVAGMAGFKFILILPVLVTLAFVFFMITFLIMGGLFAMGLFFGFSLVGILLHYVYLFLAGKGKLNRMLQMMLYSSAAASSLLLAMFLMLLTRYAGLSFPLYRVGFNLIYYFTLLYLYGLWAIAGRKSYGVPKWKAFLGAIVPVVLLLIFGVIFDKIALPILQPWII